MPSLKSCFTAFAAVLGLANAFNHDNTKKTLTITWEKYNPNGNERYTILVNGQFPAPALVFDEGDQVEITVHNHMPFNTTVHWHGMLMQDTPWSDGVPGLTQKPIEPGQSFVYRFTAYPSGTYWYHSHSRMTLMDGLYGALYIRPKPENPTNWHLISSSQKDITQMTNAAKNPTLIVASDWTNFTSWEFWDAQIVSGYDLFCTDSILVNGKGSVFCENSTWMHSLLTPFIAQSLVPKVLNDKGCFPFVKSTEGDYLDAGHPELIPYGLHEGCTPAKGPTEVFTVDAKDGWVSMNFIMASTQKGIIFSVDNHDMWLYEVDGQLVQPIKLQACSMYPGERYTVMVKLDQEPGNYTVRVTDNGISQIESAYAILQYKGGHKSLPAGGFINYNKTEGFIDYGGQLINPNYTLINGGYDHMPPFPDIHPVEVADEMYVFTLSRWNSAYSWTFTGGGVLPVDADAYTPLLYYPNSTDAMDPNLVIRTKNGTWVDIILRVGSIPREPFEISHVLHKHGSKAWTIGTGTGIWNYSSVAEAYAKEPQSFNFKNPNYKDTFLTAFATTAWYAIRYQVTNPGPWLLHCHVETHLAGGMGVVIMDGVDKWPKIPPEYAVDRHGFKSNSGA